MIATGQRPLIEELQAMCNHLDNATRVACGAQMLGATRVVLTGQHCYASLRALPCHQRQVWVHSDGRASECVTAIIDSVTLVAYLPDREASRSEMDRRVGDETTWSGL